MSTVASQRASVLLSRAIDIEVALLPSERAWKTDHRLAYSTLFEQCAIIVYSRLKRCPCLPLREGGRNINVSTLGLLVVSGMDTEMALLATKRAQLFQEKLSCRYIAIILYRHNEIACGLRDIIDCLGLIAHNREVSHTIYITVSKIMLSMAIDRLTKSRIVCLPLPFSPCCCCRRLSNLTHKYTSLS